MVDSIGGFGPVQGASPLKKPQGVDNKERGEKPRETEKARDSVEISQKALNAQEAEKTAVKTRDQLKDNENVFLGFDQSFDESA